MKKILIVILIVGVAVGGRLLYLSQQEDKQAQAPVPVITAMDILHASDLKAGVKKAVSKGDQNAIDEWMQKAVHVAEEAGLSDGDLDWLTSGQAEDYVVFNAKRALFNDAFEQRFLTLKEIDDLKQQYPEAKSLFPKAESLIEKRNQIIYSIAQALANGKEPSNQELAEAREVWKARYAERNADLTPEI